MLREREREKRKFKKDKMEESVVGGMRRKLCARCLLQHCNESGQTHFKPNLSFGVL